MADFIQPKNEVPEPGLSQDAISSVTGERASLSGERPGRFREDSPVDEADYLNEHLAAGPSSVPASAYPAEAERQRHRMEDPYAQPGSLAREASSFDREVFTSGYAESQRRPAPRMFGAEDTRARRQVSGDGSAYRTDSTASRVSGSRPRAVDMPSRVRASVGTNHAELERLRAAYSGERPALRSESYARQLLTPREQPSAFVDGGGYREPQPPAREMMAAFREARQQAQGQPTSQPEADRRAPGFAPEQAGAGALASSETFAAGGFPANAPAGSTGYPPAAQVRMEEQPGGYGSAAQPAQAGEDARQQAEQGGASGQAYQPAPQASALQAGAAVLTPDATQTTLPQSPYQHATEEKKAVKRQIVCFSFYKVMPEWRRLPAGEKQEHKQSFEEVLQRWNRPGEFLSLTYSTVGTRGDVDMCIWSIGYSVEELNRMRSELMATPLGGYLTTPFNYLSMTKRSQYQIDRPDESEGEGRGAIRPGGQKYIFIYPFWKTRPWYLLKAEERKRLMDEHIRIGLMYPRVKLNTTYSFGIDDQEFVVAFETNFPEDFLDLVQQLRETEISLYTLLDYPIFSCVRMQPMEMLDRLG